MLFYVEYKWPLGHEKIITKACSIEEAKDFIESMLQDIYDSYLYECDSINEERIEDCDDFNHQDILNNIEWIVEFYNDKNEEHIKTLQEQDKIPYEIK